MKSWISRTVVILMGIVPLANIANAQTDNYFNPGDADYLWPITVSHHLTSTFAETRAGHFHAALDLKTWGRRGYKVYATRDGVIDRLVIGPRGYGKVVYLKHPDGSYSVYAHLMAFNDELQHFADSVRIANDYSFELERFSNWRDSTVQQGDIIGYTGASGIGPPHLHFELRTPSQRPFNPLLTNLTIKDNVPPRITGLSVEPLSYRSAIEGKNSIYRQRLSIKGQTGNAKTVTTSGPVGLGINVFDQSNKVHNVYAAYKLQMWVDGRQFFQAKADSFSYQNTNQLFLDRVYPLLLKQHKGFQRLYIADGNSLPYYKTNSSKGVLNLNKGMHKVKIKATDYFGNSSSVKLNLNVVSHSSKSKINYPKKRETKSAANLQKWNWYNDWLTLSKDQYERTTIAADHSLGREYFKNGVSVDLGNQDPLFMNISGTGPVSFRRVRPGTKTFVSAADNKAFTVFPEHTFYDTVSVGMSVKNNQPESTSVKLIPQTYPLQHSYTFYVPRDSNFTNTNKYAFYRFKRFSSQQGWEHKPTHFNEKYIKVEAKSLGTFEMKKDTTAPTLGKPKLVQRPDEKWVIHIPVTDNLSGINYHKTKIKVNEEAGIPEYAPEDERFVFYKPDFTPADTIKVSVSAFDKMDNKRTADFKLFHKGK